MAFSKGKHSDRKKLTKGSRILLTLFIAMLALSAALALQNYGVEPVANAIANKNTPSTANSLKLGETFVNFSNMGLPNRNFGGWTLADYTSTSYAPSNPYGDGHIIQAEEKKLPTNYGSALSDVFMSGNLKINKSPHVWKHTKFIIGGWGASTSEIDGHSQQPYGTEAGVAANTRTYGSYTGFYIKTYPYESLGRTDLSLVARIPVSDEIKRAIFDPMLNVTAKAVLLGYNDGEDAPASFNITLEWVNDNTPDTAVNRSVNNSLVFESKDDPIYTEGVSLSRYDETNGSHLKITIDNISAIIKHETTGGDLNFWDAAVMTGVATSSEKAVSGLSINLEYLKVIIEAKIPEQDLEFNSHNVPTDVVVTDGAKVPGSETRHTKWNDSDSIWDSIDYNVNGQSFTKYVKAGDLITVSTMLRNGSSDIFLNANGTVDVITYPGGNKTSTVRDSLYRNLMLSSNDAEKTRLRAYAIDCAVNFLRKSTDPNRQAAVTAVIEGLKAKYGTATVNFDNIASTITSGASGSHSFTKPDVNSLSVTDLKLQFEIYINSYVKACYLDKTPIIQWSYPEDYLEIVDQTDLTGQSITFRVKSNISEFPEIDITIAPYLQYWTGGKKDPSQDMPDLMPVYTTMSMGFVLLLDSSPPAQVVFDTSDNLFKNYISVDDYYVDGYSSGLRSVTYVSGYGSAARKNVSNPLNTTGSFITVKLHSSVFSVTGSPHYIYYTTDGTNPLTSSTRLLLLDCINKNSTYTTELYFRLSDGAMRAGTFSLQFVAIDYAGNVGDLSERYQVKIDCTSYTIRATVAQTGVISDVANSTSTSKYGTIYFGRMVGASIQWTKAGEASYKRNDVFYIRIEVKKQSVYRLYQYYNNGTRMITNDSIWYGKWEAYNWGDFEVTSQDRTNDNAIYYLTRNTAGNNTGIPLNSAMLENPNNLMFTLVFKEKLNITVGSTQATYDGSEKTIGQPSLPTFASVIITTYYLEPRTNTSGNIIVPEESEFKSTTPFRNAGTYYYLCVIDDATYCGTKMGQFIIKKADPLIVDLQLSKIYYGDSMAVSTIQCRDITNLSGQITYNSDRSSDGLVFGQFSITDPAPTAGNVLYMTPNQGYHSVEVQFMPSETYASNYNTIKIKTTLHVDYSSQLVIVFNEASFTSTYKAGERKYASATTYPEQQLIYEYKLVTQDEKYFTTDAPINAGVYDVRVRTDLSRSNYNNQKSTVDDNSLKFVINRAEVNVTAAPVSCYYQYDYDPPAVAYLKIAGGGNGSIAPVNAWSYSYSTNGVDYSPYRPVNSGAYQVKIQVNSYDEATKTYTGNFTGEGVTTLTIKKGNADSASTGYSILYPMLAAVNNTNIYYGQSLGAITYMPNADAIARYSFRNPTSGIYEQRQVEGVFFIANREYNPIIDLSPSDYRQKMGALILNADKYSQTNALYNVFIPNDLTNFNITYQRESVNISKTTPDFSNVRLNNLVFEDVAEMVVMPGYTKAVIDGKTVYTIASNQIIDGKPVNPSAYGIILTGSFTFAGRANTPLNSGTQKISYTFVPDDTKNINSVKIDLTVQVDKGPLTVDITSEYLQSDGKLHIAYGNNFMNPAVTCYRQSGSVLTQTSYSVSYSYFSENDLSAAILINNLTPVGKYKMVIKITHPNLYGEYTADIEIEKLNPVLSVYPVMSSVEYMTDMNTVTLSGGRVQHPKTNVVIQGTFSLIGESGVIAPSPESTGNTTFKIRFTPNDSSNIEILFFDMIVNVKKATTTITLSNLNHIYNGSVNMPAATTNVVLRTVNNVTTRVVLASPGDYNPVTDRYIPVTFYCSATVDNSIPVNAGTYLITATADDLYYQGTVSAQYVISQVDARIVVVALSREQVYTGIARYLEYYVETLDGTRLNNIAVSQIFNNYNNDRLVSAPSAIGLYTVSLEIRDTNYRGTASSTLLIKIPSVYFTDTLLTYGDGKAVTVSYEPESAIKDITYRRINDDGSFGIITAAAPVDAGRYQVTVSFSAVMNNGYAEVFTSVLEIRKANVALTYTGTFVYTYTGYVNSKLPAALNAIKTSVTAAFNLVRYAEFYVNDSFTKTEPVDAGTYQMRVSIQDANYSGSEIFEYKINPARPVIVTNPASPTFIYMDDGRETALTGGRAVFDGADIPGTYNLTDSLSGINAGTVNRGYTFTPDDGRNFEKVYGTVAVIIDKKDLSENIVFSGNNSVNYNTLAHSVSASVDTGVNVLVEIYYNGLKSAPSARGNYTVAAKISDKNYKGERTWEKTLNIGVGIPLIVKPTLSPVKLNNGTAALSSTEIRGGYAYIDGIGTVINGVPVTETITTIGGTFSLTNPLAILTKANTQLVEITFKPYSQDFASVTVLCPINVIGLDPVLGTVSASLINPEKPMYYGYKVGEYYKLSFAPVVNATPGLLTFEDPDYIPMTGEKVKYVFTPEDTDTYNIIRGEISVSVNKANASSSEPVIAKVFFGSFFPEATFTAVLVNQYNTQLYASGNFEIIYVNGFVDLSVMITAAAVRAAMGNPPNETQSMLMGRYRFTSDNYNTVEGDLYIYFYNEVPALNIIANKLSKEYDGKAISAKDLSLDAAGTLHQLTDANFIVTVYDETGKISDGKDIGKYTVKIEINDMVYYGVKTVTYTVNKRNISSLISLSYVSGVYGDSLPKPSALLSETIPALTAANFRIELKRTSETDISFNETMPAGAGIYNVRVTVINSNVYTGTAMLTFTIEKKVLTYTAQSVSEYYGRNQSLLVGIQDGLAEPVVYYYNQNYAMSLIPPTEVGKYTARVTVISNNYKISSGGNEYVEFSYEILQSPLTLRELPVSTGLIYGQSYKDAILTGGRVTLNESVQIAGTFSFLYPDSKPLAGSIRTYVIFTPVNKNYSSVQGEIIVNVRRADANVVFTNLSSVYNGTNRKDKLTYVGLSEVGWVVQFMQDGYTVNPINAGRYNVRLSITNPNYQFGVDGGGNPVTEKENAAVFIIDKASYSSFNPPIPTNIKYGQSLASSTLNTSEAAGYGMVTYSGIEGYVRGNFVYSNSGLVLGDAGLYVVDIKFVPDDQLNFNGFNSKVGIEVLIATANIVVGKNVFTYGTPITLPSFTTNPSNLSVAHNIDCIGEIRDCGTYSYRAWVVSKNYYDASLPMSENNYIDFTITIQKKEIELEFTLDGVRVDKYHTTYQKILFAKAVTKPGAVLARDLYSEAGLHIDGRIMLYYYTMNDVLVGVDGHTPPSAIGDYKVIARLDDQYCNYTGQAVIYYDILLGVIESVSFDIATLEKQVYGSVVPPIITTKPSGVQYYIDYQGSGLTLPSNAGTHNLIVYFKDPNFEPKTVSAMFIINKKQLTLNNIQVEDKVYDGVSRVAISASLTGVYLSDEVKLSIEARTAGGKIEAGRHNVEITKYAISGVSASNYFVAAPVFSGQITIYEKRIVDTASSSFVTSNVGFAPGITVEFKTITSANNGENWFSNFFGQKATVESFTIRDNGLGTTLSEMVMVYIKIPDEYLNAKNLKFVGLGQLSDRQINFVREGDYVTFYTDCSGEVAFVTNDFNYWTIGAIASVGIMLLGIVLLIMLNPRHRRTATSDRKSEKEYAKASKKGQIYKD